MKGAILAILCMATVARAQGVDRRYAEEPTDGVDIPTTPLAGEHDARAVTYNPGGLALLRGWEAAVILVGGYKPPLLGCSNGFRGPV